jgi:hypothetical protein
VVDDHRQLDFATRDRGTTLQALPLRSSKPEQGIPAIVTNKSHWSASVTCSMRMKNMSRARTIRFLKRSKPI